MEARGRDGWREGRQIKGREGGGEGGSREERTDGWIEGGRERGREGERGGREESWE